MKVKASSVLFIMVSSVCSSCSINTCWINELFVSDGPNMVLEV